MKVLALAIWYQNIWEQMSREVEVDSDYSAPNIAATFKELQGSEPEAIFILKNGKYAPIYLLCLDREKCFATGPLTYSEKEE